MLFENVKAMSRGEKAFVNVATYIGLYPKSQITDIEIFTRAKTITVRVNYTNERNAKEYVHTFTFYRYDEKTEAQLFVDMLTDAFSNITIKERSE